MAASVFKTLVVTATLEGQSSFGPFTAKRVLTSKQFGNKPWRIDWFHNGKKVAKKDVETEINILDVLTES